jgi:hypothetical protein
MNLHHDLPAAVISDCSQYRYLLSRRIGFSDRIVAFIGLNPSTADANLDDPTIRRCIGFAKRRDAGLLLMVNLFALRSTDPKALRLHPAPVGPENDSWIDRAMSISDIAIAAWGNGGALMGRSDSVRQRFQGRLQALAITNTGMPKHPLYVRGDAETSDF